MGICVAPSGDLYYADNQFFQSPETSRVMRIVMKDGKPQKAVTVVSGMNVANAVAMASDGADRDLAGHVARRLGP